MKTVINISIKLATFYLLLFLTVTASIAQEFDGTRAKLQLDKLSRLEEKADEVVEVNIDGRMLDLAKRVLLKVKDKNAQKVAVAIAGLKGIYVKVYNFEKGNQYAVADIDDVRAQLNSPNWERMVNVRSKKDNEKIDVFTMFTGDKVSGLAVVVSDSDSVAVINAVGSLDLEMLAELSGHLAIPKIEIEQDKTQKPKD
jgi:hypothetical protein